MSGSTFTARSGCCASSMSRFLAHPCPGKANSSRFSVVWVARHWIESIASGSGNPQPS